MFKKIACSLLFLLSAGPVQATALDCPKRIAGISNNLFAQQFSNIVEKIYQELGCQTEFVSMPGNRAVISFRNGAVDGEVFRLQAIEKQYSSGTFLRSPAPMMTIENIVVSHKMDRARPHNDPIGYQLGIMWQMDYVTNKQAVSFNDPDQLIETFSQGKIHQFLTTQTSLEAYIADKRIDPELINVETVSMQNLYHYVHANYAAFMAAFASYIEKHDPFHEFKLVLPKKEAD